MTEYDVFRFSIQLWTVLKTLL